MRRARPKRRLRCRGVRPEGHEPAPVNVSASMPRVILWGMQSVAAAVEPAGDARGVAERREAGHAFAAAGQELALVGGPVRDAFLGRPVNDLDFTTMRTPDEILAIVDADRRRALGHRPRVRHHRRADRRASTVEITTYRADAYDGDDPQARRSSSADTLEGDLVRRDFTVNALALRLPAARAGRPVRRRGGPARRPAAPRRRPPEASFGDDPLRMLRAARFIVAAGLHRRRRPRGRRCTTLARQAATSSSAERISDELRKLLQHR